MVAGRKPLARAPGCLCSDLGQHLCKTEHCGQQARLREEWLVLLVVDAELRDHPHPMPASALDCCHPRFLSHLSLGQWSMVLPGALTPARGCFLPFSGGWALIPSLPLLQRSSALTQLHGLQCSVSGSSPSTSAVDQVVPPLLTASGPAPFPSTSPLFLVWWPPDLSGASPVSGVFCLRACGCCSLCSELFYHTPVLQSFACLIL